MSLHRIADRAGLPQVVPASSMPVFAHERLLPVHDALRPLFTPVFTPASAMSPTSDESAGSPVGLVRGQTVVCSGPAAVSCALGLAAGATRAGSWAAIVGLPSIGVLAAATVGVSLERTVFIEHPDARPADNGPNDGSRGDFGAVLSALIDGIDVIVIGRRCMAALSASLVRRLQTRAQSKGSVLVIVGDPSAVSVDIRFTARTVHWEGLGDGHGHLRRRLVAVEMDGRRCPRSRVHTVWLPDSNGELAPADDGNVIALRRVG